MFSTLDSIDWKKLGYHTYGENEMIPRAIRDLLSPDEKAREEARGFLLGAQQDFGDIYDTTPRIIPFCLEALAMDGALDPASHRWRRRSMGAPNQPVLLLLRFA